MQKGCLVDGIASALQDCAHIMVKKNFHTQLEPNIDLLKLVRCTIISTFTEQKILNIRNRIACLRHRIAMLTPECLPDLQNKEIIHLMPVH